MEYVRIPLSVFGMWYLRVGEVVQAAVARVVRAAGRGQLAVASPAAGRAAHVARAHALSRVTVTPHPRIDVVRIWNKNSNN